MPPRVVKSLAGTAATVAPAPEAGTAGIGTSPSPGGSHFRYVATAVRSASLKYCVLWWTTSTMLPETLPNRFCPVLSICTVSGTVHKLRRLGARQTSTVSPAR